MPSFVLSRHIMTDSFVVSVWAITAVYDCNNLLDMVVIVNENVNLKNPSKLFDISTFFVANSIFECELLYWLDVTDVIFERVSCRISC